MAEDLEGAILQRDKRTYAIVPRTPVGLVTPDELERIAATARKFEIPLIKITSGQRFALIGIEPDQLDAVWRELNLGVGKATELCLHYVQACPGTEVCKFGVQDSLGLGKKIEEFFASADVPAKFKIGVSGCPFCCAESYVRDIGLLAKKSGWTLIVGGSSSRNPRIGDAIRDNLTEDEVIPLIERLLAHYRTHAKPRERLAKFVDRVGIDSVKAALG